MIGRLKTRWFPSAAVALLLGSLFLDNLAIAVIAAALLVAGVVFMPRERLRGSTAAAIGFVAAASIAVILRLLR